MKASIVRSLVVVAIVALSACAGRFGGSSLLPASNEALGGNLSVGELAVMMSPRDLACPHRVGGFEQCYAIVGTYPLSMDETPRAGSCLHKPGCYVARDLQEAYGITLAARTRGKGVTVAVVDAFGYPDAAHDLEQYRTFAKLPKCGSCLKIVNESGGSRLPKPGTGMALKWQFEQALDIDMVSAMCPNCTILLVQTNSDVSTSLENGVKTALKSATIVSNSWGGGEGAPTDPIFDNHPGKVITASAGDNGAGAIGTGYTAPATQPCGFAGVVCVGGSSLVLDAGVRRSEVVWQDFNVTVSGKAYDLGATGSGCSAVVAKPAWQTDKGCAKRSAADISADADPITGVVTACTPCEKYYKQTSPLLGGWGGTSASAPMIAAMFALAGNASTLQSASQTIWSHGGSKDFNAITSGYNDKRGQTGLVCTAHILYICQAGTKMNGTYSGPTGWGTPHGLGAL
ncbi:MAG: S8 family serine peptidase [Candidatus Eremiobacteraeota bacterium]|nr:S8 family serine peptidase [Candidatus Eremiobacteraeota bacterium]